MTLIRMKLIVIKLKTIDSIWFNYCSAGSHFISDDLDILMPNVILPSVVLLNVVAPCQAPKKLLVGNNKLIHRRGANLINVFVVAADASGK